MNERIKKIRKELDLTQQEFAARIGSVQNTITGYETGRRVPSSQVISLICREFGVNENWLRTGEGEMFAPAPSSALDALAQERGLTHREYIVLEKFLLLRPEVRADLIDCLMDIAAAINSDDIPAGTPAMPKKEMTAEELHAELDRQLKAQETAKEKSGAS
jgi:transcriptional regulator with XRE-family HTH domain